VVSEPSGEALTLLKLQPTMYACHIKRYMQFAVQSVVQPPATGSTLEASQWLLWACVPCRQSLKAVQSGNVFLVDGNQHFNRPGEHG
jgi:hypothetical protein